ncbi:hypothetical protein RhiJN_25910 [Ceratobasidium sp. AG-Ba]|nr:hypothetical protein RhiJN_25910 [Ceratobasidium sp. AG-Ba]
MDRNRGIGRAAAHALLFPVNAPLAVVRRYLSKDKCLIDFTGSKREEFLPWCEAFGDIVTFTELEYRRDRGRPEHEFIRLGGFKLNGNLPSSPKSPPSRIWGFFTSDNLGDLVCRLERTAGPDAYVNALTGTAAAGWVTVYLKGSKNDKQDLEELRELLKINFSEERKLDEVFDICYRLSVHSKSCDYTLPQFNCYFFSWNIILGLTRSSALYERLLQEHHHAIVTQVVNNLHSFAVSEDQRFNLALILSGHLNHPRTGSNNSSPFMKILEEHVFDKKFLDDICTHFASNLWTREQLTAISRAVRPLLDAVAAASTQLVLAETGANSLNDLFNPSSRINWDLGPEWVAEIEVQCTRVFRRYLSEEMWEMFGAALDQTDQAVRQKNKVKLPKQELSFSQKALYNDPVLMSRLVPLGWETVLKNAQVAASLDPNAKNNPLVQARHFSQQYRSLAQVAGRFVSLAGARLEEKAASGSEVKIIGTGRNVRELITDMTLQPDMNTQVIGELIESVKNMARKFPGQDYGTLRRATLKLMVDVSTRGKQLSFSVEPVMVWQLALWYSLSDCIINSVQEINTSTIQIQDKQHDCKCVDPKVEIQESTVADAEAIPGTGWTNLQIQAWIHERVQALSRKAYKDQFGCAESSQRELERVASEIWEGQQLWRNIRYHSAPAAL